MKVDTRNILMAAWYLNKLSLPSDKEMTAYETSERIAEYIRSAGPIFEPFEADNARTLEAMFAMSLRIGYFGPLETIPPEIRGGEIQFEFDTPVSQAYRRVKVVRAQEVLQTLKMSAEVDPSVRHIVNVPKMFRATIQNLGADTEWMNTEEEVAELIAQDQEQAAQAMEAEKQQKMMEIADKAAGAGQKGMGALSQLPGFAAQAQQLLQGQQQPQPPQDQAEGFPLPEDPFGDLGIDIGALTDGLDIDPADLEASQ